MQVWWSPAERAALDARAGELGMRSGAFVKKVVLEVLGPVGVSATVAEEVPAPLPAVRRSVGVMVRDLSRLRASPLREGESAQDRAVRLHKAQRALDEAQGVAAAPAGGRPVRRGSESRVAFNIRLADWERVQR